MKRADRLARTLTLVFALLVGGAGIVRAQDAADYPIVREIVARELRDTKKAPDKRFCLGFPSDGSHSSTARDPSPELVTYLSRAGMTVHGVSVCYSAFSGIAIEINRIRHLDSTVLVEVDAIDCRAPRDAHFATLLRSRAYTLRQDKKGAWRIRSFKRLRKP